MELKDYKYHFFLSHASQNRDVAVALYRHLSQRYEVFLDSKSLLPGDEWTTELCDSIRRSMISVVLLSKHTSASHYQREEIARAVELAGKQSDRHRVIPVYLDSPDACQTPFGLSHIHAINAEQISIEDVHIIAKQLIAVLENLSPQENIRHGMSARKRRKLGRAVSWGKVTERERRELKTKPVLIKSLINEPWAKLADPPVDREFLESELSEIWRNRRPLALLYLDVDGMTAINTYYGTLVGNKVLQTIDQIIRQVAPKDLVSRCGKDEFVVCADNSGEIFTESLRSRAKNLSHEISDYISQYPWEEVSPSLYVTASIGFAISWHDESPEEWIVRAIHGCFFAKRRLSRAACGRRPSSYHPI